jgi:S-DNA-T family DNA segregation ATPase FtsK/SpoIIIE
LVGDQWVGTGDLGPLACLAHRYRAGDDEPDVDYVLGGPARVAPGATTPGEGDPGVAPAPVSKRTKSPELADTRSHVPHPVVIGVDECQVWFEHPTYGEEFEDICTDLVKRGPVLGFVLIVATQRPDTKSLPTGISAKRIHPVQKQL